MSVREMRAQIAALLGEGRRVEARAAISAGIADALARRGRALREVVESDRDAAILRRAMDAIDARDLHASVVPAPCRPRGRPRCARAEEPRQ